MKKKILKIIADSHPPDARVQKEVNSLKNNGYLVDIICWDRDANKNLPANVENDHGQIIRYKKNSKRGKAFTFIINNISFYIFILLRARKIEYDFIHVHSIQVLPIGIILKIISNKPLIYDVHEITETFGTNIHKSFGALVWNIEKRLLNFVDIVFTVSESLKVKYQKVIKKDSEIEVLLNCLPLQEYAYRANKISDNIFTIGRIGNLRVKSRIDLISDVIVLLNKRGHKVKFKYSGMIIGDYLDQFEEAEKKMGEYSDYTKWIPLDKFFEFYSTIDLVLNIHEPGNKLEEKYAYFSKVFESISFGVPCVINNFPSMNSIIRENNIGLVVDELNANSFADEIERLIKDDKQLKKMSDNCHKLAIEEINWNLMEKRLIKCYLKIQN